MAGLSGCTVVVLPQVYGVFTRSSTANRLVTMSLCLLTGFDGHIKIVSHNS